VGRLVRGLALWIGLYVLLTGAHMGVLYGINALRARYELGWRRGSARKPLTASRPTAAANDSSSRWTFSPAPTGRNRWR
jgi:hypothetical protein